MEITATVRNIPALRFPEFEGEWENTTLGDFLTFKNGVNADKEKYGSGYKFINVMDIINNRYITHDKIIGSVEISEKEFQKNEVKYGDILFQRSSETREEVGQSNVYLDKEKSATFGGFVIRGQASKEYNPLFMHFLLKTDFARKEITTRSGGSTRYNVGQASLREVNVILPTIVEQQKIASFLTIVDDKIQQLSKKKELLGKYKKEVMKQIFSQQVRFKDDNGNEFPEWEEKTLDELVEFRNGKAHENDISSNGEFVVVNSKFISSEGAVRKYSDKQISPLEEGEVVMVMSDVPNGKALAKCFIILENGRYTLNQRICALKAICIDAKFLFYSLNRNKYYLMFDSGVGQTNLAKDQVLKCPLFIPVERLEQTKIANFLTSIDNKLNYTSKQLEQAQQFKKGLLQQLFV